MTNKTISALEIRCAKLEDSLRKARNLLAAARRRAAKREAIWRDRRCLSLGAAIEAAIIHRWSAQQTQTFLAAVTQAYPVDVVSQSLRGITEPGWISHEAVRERRLHWGMVARRMLLSAQIGRAELELVVRSRMQPPQRNHALGAIASVEKDFDAPQATASLAFPTVSQNWCKPPI